MALKWHYFAGVVIVLVFIAVSCSFAFGQTIYVDVDAPGPTYDGSSWADAYLYLQEGLAAASSGDEVRVAQGTYKPHEGMVYAPEIERELTFRLKNGVVTKGGYAGYGTPDPNARDIKVYETILSGDLNCDDGPNFANNSDNSYHVVYQTYCDSTAVLDGFTITGGNANGSYPHSYGGGMYNYGKSGSPAIPTISNCTFFGNYAKNYGGGIYSHYSYSTVTNCKFIANSAGSDGGGVYNNSCRLTVVNCIFSGNSANRGGGMHNHISNNQVLINCTFSGNSANTGGGICNDHSTTNATLANCILWGNSDNGGTDESAQIYHSGGVLVVNYCCIESWTGSFGGTGNIDNDPLFIDPNGVDNVVGTKDDNLRLLAYSSCIDAGDPNYVPEPNETDLDGNSRIIGDCIDMGGYEFKPKICCADFSGDLFVNFRDFCVLAQEWLEQGDSLKTDLIDDNKINELDLGAFCEQWLAPCYECNEVDIYSDGKIDFKDYSLLAANWLKQGSLAGDITGNGIVDMVDLKTMVFHWLKDCYESPIIITQEVLDCSSESQTSREELASEELRFSVTVQGDYIYFEDMIYANCCFGDFLLEMEIDGNEITIYEIAQIQEYCRCMCDSPATATLGPFAEGEYLFEAVNVDGNSLGTIPVTIGSLNFAEYWPFAVGNRWESELVPDAGFTLEITNRFTVNNFEIWEFTNEVGTIWGGWVEVLYYVYVNGALHVTDNPADLFSLPDVTGDLQPRYPEIVQTGIPVNIPNLGMVTPIQGTLSGVLKNTGLTIDDFPLGYQPDVLAFVPVGSEEDIIVFARGLGPMRLNAPYLHFIAEATITE